MKKVYIYIGIGVAVLLAVAVYFAVQKNKIESVSPATDEAALLTTENTSVVSGTVNHTNPDFSFSYPKEWKVTSFSDAEGETILLRDQSTGGDVQVYIAPFDEETVITADRVKRDIPDMKVLEPMQIEIGKTVSGVYFKTQKSGIGESQEIWFARNHFLYQISAVKTHPKALADMVATFSFK